MVFLCLRLSKNQHPSAVLLLMFSLAAGVKWSRWLYESIDLCITYYWRNKTVSVQEWMTKIKQNLLWPVCFKNNTSIKKHSLLYIKKCASSERFLKPFSRWCSQCYKFDIMNKNIYRKVHVLYILFIIFHNEFFLNSSF